jgi:hypothetical protein
VPDTAGISVTKFVHNGAVDSSTIVMSRVMGHIRVASSVIGAPAGAAKRSGPTDQWRRLCGADYEIVKVAAYLKSTRLFEPADL